MATVKKVTYKSTLINNIEKSIIEEEKISVGRITGQIKQARKKANLPLNINEKQLRVHLIEEVKKIKKKIIPKIVNKLLEEIKKSLLKKENILLRGYFSLRVNRSVARRIRNPKDGRLMVIPARNRLGFRTSSKLKREINQSKYVS